MFFERKSRGRWDSSCPSPGCCKTLPGTEETHSHRSKDGKIHPGPSTPLERVPGLGRKRQESRAFQSAASHYVQQISHKLCPTGRIPTNVHPSQALTLVSRRMCINEDADANFMDGCLLFFGRGKLILSFIQSFVLLGCEYYFLIIWYFCSLYFFLNSLFVVYLYHICLIVYLFIRICLYFFFFL